MAHTAGQMPKTDTELKLRAQVEELKLRVDSLHNIRKDYEEIIENATEFVFKLDCDGIFYFVSAEFERVLNFTNEEILGRHFTSIIHRDDLNLCIETFKVLEEFGRANGNIDFRVVQKSGNYRWVNCSAVCLFDKDGKPSHFIGLAHDITELHNVVLNLRSSEKALRISEERYRSLFEALSEGTVLFNQKGSIIASNLSAEKIFGVTKEQLQEFNSFNSVNNFIYEDGRSYASQTHPSAITLTTGKSLKDVVMGIEKRDGTMCWVSINTEPIYYSDNREKPDAVVASFIDITQARRDKVEIIKNQQLLAIENDRYIKATKAVAQAVVDAQEKERAEIGVELHDNINQILSTVRLYLDLAVINENERVNLIKRSSEGLANAVSEIRKISQSLVPASLNDLGLIASIQDLADSVMVAGNLNVEFYHIGDIESISPKRKLVLFRIIQEQVTNVLKHAGASQLFIEVVADLKTISLSISDNGIGFDKKKIKGKKGVGLYNIANRAELFNGKVTMITSPGKGCKLNILIPI
jgi:PAS domain S-box-containing protein